MAVARIRETLIWRSILGCMLAMCLAISPSAGQAQPLEKLTVGISSVGPDQAGLLAAKEAGFFMERGLEVEFQFFSGAMASIQAVMSGHVSVASFAGVPLVRAVLAGADLTAIAELLGTLPYKLFVSPEIASPADLKGKRLGVNRYGSSADMALRFALAKLGLDPKRDVTILQIGERPLRLAALQGRSIDGTVFIPPENVAAGKLGFRELTDIARLGLKHPAALVVIPRGMIEKHPETLRRFMTAVILGTHAFKTRREEGIQVLRKYLKNDDPEALVEAHSVFSALMHEKPFVAPEGVQLVLDEVAKDNPRAKTARPQDFFDMRFVRELDESGFLNRLYKQ